MNFSLRVLSLMGAAILGLVPISVPTWADPTPLVRVQAPALVSPLMKMLRIDDVVEVMRLEGVEYGAQMEADLFPGKGGASWASIVAMIYDGPTMLSRFDAAFARQLVGGEVEIAQIQAFFGTELGQRILALEIEARHSLMDDAIKDAATARVEDMEAAGDARFEVLLEFSQVNDLIEANVSGALNSNLAFFQGMAEVGALAQDMTEEDMLMDVWSQEPDIRAETEAWVFPYLALAYGPLSDADMAAYLSFSKTKAGQKLNNALFGAFDEFFRAISRDLGRAAAKQMMGEDI
jgi:hypothetical protein